MVIKQFRQLFSVYPRTILSVTSNHYTSEQLGTLSKVNLFTFMTDHFT